MSIIKEHKLSLIDIGRYGVCNQTYVCVLGFTSITFQKYNEIFKSNYSIIHSYQESANLQKELNKIISNLI
jgi:hypothetical protein